MDGIRAYSELIIDSFATRSHSGSVRIMIFWILVTLMSLGFRQLWAKDVDSDWMLECAWTE